jgi:hypothetical protein
MSSIARSLIQAVEANGGRIRVDGDWLVIHPRKAGEPIADALRLYKAEIVDFLHRTKPRKDLPPMPPGVRLVRWEPKKPPVRLPSGGEVVEIELFARSTLRQLDAHLQGKSWLAGNWGLSTLIARLEAVGYCVALENPSIALQ